jgi:hypothetical protein
MRINDSFSKVFHFHTAFKNKKIRYTKAGEVFYRKKYFMLQEVFPLEMVLQLFHAAANKLFILATIK